MSVRRIFSLALASFFAVTCVGFFHPAQAGSSTYEIEVNSSNAGLMQCMGGYID